MLVLKNSCPIREMKIIHTKYNHTDYRSTGEIITNRFVYDYKFKSIDIEEEQTTSDHLK